MPITVRYDVPAETAGPVAYGAGFDVARGAQEQADVNRRWQMALQQMQQESTKKNIETQARASAARSEYGSGSSLAAAQMQRQWALEDQDKAAAEADALRRQTREYAERDWARDQKAQGIREKQTQDATYNREMAIQRERNAGDMAEAQLKEPTWGESIYGVAKDVAGGLSNFMIKGAENQTKVASIAAANQRALENRTSQAQREQSRVYAENLRYYRGIGDKDETTGLITPRFSPEQADQMARAAAAQAGAYLQQNQAGAVQAPQQAAPGVPEKQLLDAYRNASPEQRARMRAQLGG
jgi:hypothetical protein